MHELLVFPDITKGNDPSAFHLPRLLKELEGSFGIQSRYITATEFNQYANHPPLTGTKLLVNWLDTLYFSSLSRKAAIAASLLPAPIQRSLANAISERTLSRFRTLQLNKNRLVFFYHDTETFSRIPIIQLIDQICRPRIHQLADAAIFASDSARRFIENKNHIAKKSYISCLGDYREAHGPHREKQQVRSSFGIPADATVLVALGTLRTNRRLDRILRALRSHGDLFLICAGRGNSEFRESNILSKAGYLSDSEIADLLGCGDYLLHTGEGYLTSASVRTGLSYGLPVIAEPFGATIDMCGPALVELRQDCAPETLFSRLPRRDSLEYKNIAQLANVQDQKFTWKSAAEGLYNAINAS